MKNEVATLEINDKKYTVFQVGDIRIKFYTSPYLQRYCKINRWDDEGYIERCNRGYDRLENDGTETSSSQ